MNKSLENDYSCGNNCNVARTGRWSEVSGSAMTSAGETDQRERGPAKMKSISDLGLSAGQCRIVTYTPQV
jgi:hypothetical protein